MRNLEFKGKEKELIWQKDGKQKGGNDLPGY